MTPSRQKHGGCGHSMAAFDTHSFCARCRDKGKGTDPYVANNDCFFCNVMTGDQHAQLSTPSYKLKKEKRDLKEKSDKSDSYCGHHFSPHGPALVSVVGVVDIQGIL